MTEREARISLEFAHLQGEFKTIKADNERYRTDLQTMTERAVKAETERDILRDSPGQGTSSAEAEWKAGDLQAKLTDAQKVLFKAEVEAAQLRGRLEELEKPPAWQFWRR